MGRFEEAFMAVEAKSIFNGHEIVARIAFWEQQAAKLYIDGKVVDTSSETTGNGSLLRGAIEDAGKTHVVEIKRRFSFTAPKIFVDNKMMDQVK
jgi:hypothetical protein